jgi:hypothetical protein
MRPIRTIDFPLTAARAIMRSRREDGAMHVNDYLLERMVRDRLAERRAEARRAALATRARRGGVRWWRAALGHALIRLGQALVSEPARRARHA